MSQRSSVRPRLGANFAQLAQLVERRPFKPVVVGSSPTLGAFLGIIIIQILMSMGMIIRFIIISLIYPISNIIMFFYILYDVDDYAFSIALSRDDKLSTSDSIFVNLDCKSLIVVC